MFNLASFIAGVTTTLIFLLGCSQLLESSVDSLCKKHFEGSVYSYDLEDCVIEVKK